MQDSLLEMINFNREDYELPTEEEAFDNQLKWLLFVIISCLVYCFVYFAAYEFKTIAIIFIGIAGFFLKNRK